MTLSITQIRQKLFEKLVKNTCANLLVFYIVHIHKTNMTRPRKHRHCCCQIYARVFKPSGIPLCKLTKMVIADDELEALRLCDALDLTQEQAGEAMGVSRGTVQRLVSSARKKIALAISQGMAIVVNDSQEVKDEGCNSN